MIHISIHTRIIIIPIVKVTTTLMMHIAIELLVHTIHIISTLSKIIVVAIVIMMIIDIIIIELISSSL